MQGDLSLLEQSIKRYKDVFLENETAEEMINDVLVVLRNYGFWEDQLQDLAKEHASLQTMLEKAADVIRNPFTICDIDGNLIASANLEKGAADPVLKYMAENKKMEPSILTHRFYDRNGNVHPDLYDYPIYLMPDGNAKSGAVNMYLSLENEHLAYAEIFCIDPSEESLDESAMRFLRPILLSAEEFTSPRSSIRADRSILSDLLSGKTLPDEAILKFEKNRHISGPFQLMIIRSNAIRNYTQRSIMIQDFYRLQTPCFLLNYQDHIVLLSNESETAAILAEIQNPVHIRNVQNCTIGLSMPFFNLWETSRAYKQARFAIRDKNENGIFDCRSFAFDYMLQTLSENESTQELLHPAIRILAHYDKENGTSLLETLRIYLQNSQNQIHTAAALFIHRNTLKYRLERIRELTHIDFSDSHDLLYLTLSLQLYKAA